MSQAQDLDRIAVEGFHYFFPLVLMDVTRQVATAVPLGRRSGFGPPNAFSHMREFPPGDFREVVRPNFDTLYSTAWLDLTRDVQVVSVTRPVDRYFLLPLLDMWTDVFAVIGTRTTGGGVGHYALVPPGWQGRLPAGVERIDAPTPWVWIVGRTQTNGAADYPAVHAIQDGFVVRSLAEWPDGPPVATGPDPAGDVDTATAPPDQLAGMSGREFFRRAAALLEAVPPHLTDQPILARLRRLGLVPGRFDVEQAAPEVLDAIDAAPRAALERMRAAVAAAPVVDGWSVRCSGIGVYGTDYLYRAVIAMIGLGANLPEDAVYPLNLVDERGEPPVGERDYVLHFDADALPPVDAFWSLTMYDGEGFPVPNELDRYALGDRDPLVYAADGSLDLLVRRSDPGAQRAPNWLPAPEGPLGLTLRLYGPRPPVLDGRWTAPPLRRA